MTTLTPSAAANQIELTDLVIDQENTLYIDSRIVATQLDINHSDWVQDTIKKYQTQLEQEFGVLRFETGKPQRGTKGGRPENFYFLTEDQALALLTLSRNNQAVVQCKFNLVKTFAQARRELESQNKPQEGIKLPTDFVESLELLLASEKEKKALAAANKELQAVTTELQIVNTELAPKAAAADLLLEKGDNLTFQEAAQLIGIPKMGRNNLFKALISMKMIIDSEHPYQRYVDQGIFVLIERSVEKFGGSGQQILITQKGLQYLIPKVTEYSKRAPRHNDPQKAIWDAFKPKAK